MVIFYIFTKGSAKLSKNDFEILHGAINDLKEDFKEKQAETQNGIKKINSEIADLRVLVSGNYVYKKRV